MDFNASNADSPGHSKGSKSDLPLAERYFYDKLPESSIFEPFSCCFSALSFESDSEDVSASVNLEKYTQDLFFDTTKTEPKSAEPDFFGGNKYEKHFPRKRTAPKDDQEGSHIVKLIKTSGNDSKKISSFIQGRPSDLKNGFQKLNKKISDLSLDEVSQFTNSETHLPEPLLNPEKTEDINRKDQLILLYKKANKIKDFIERSRKIITSEMKPSFL